MDRISKERRSWNMAQIRSKNTKPELLVRSLLHRMGFRFRLNSTLPGHPDLVMPKYGTAVFVHGCFWHRHAGCKYSYFPKSREAFWKDKFDANVRRDKTVKVALKKAGWRVMIVWECQTQDIEALSAKLDRELRRFGGGHR